MCEIENDYQFQFYAPKVIRHSPYYIVAPKTFKLGTISADRNCDTTNKADIKDCFRRKFS